MKRRAAIAIPSLNAENSLSRLHIQSMHLFPREVTREICADANLAIREGAVGIPITESSDYETAISNPRKVSLDGSSTDATCLSSSLITQLSSISIKEEKKSSTNPITPTKHGSFPFTFSKSLQTRIKMAKRPSAPGLTSKKRVHSRRRNRVVILNSKTIMTTTQKERKSIDPCLHFESISLSPCKY